MLHLVANTQAPGVGGWWGWNFKGLVSTRLLGFLFHLELRGHLTLHCWNVVRLLVCLTLWQLGKKIYIAQSHIWYVAARRLKESSSVSIHLNFHDSGTFLTDLCQHSPCPTSNKIVKQVKPQNSGWGKSEPSTLSTNIYRLTQRLFLSSLEHHLKSPCQEKLFQRRGVRRGGISRTLLQGYQLFNFNQMNQRSKWLKDQGQFYLDVALSRKKGQGKDGQLQASAF